VTPEQVSRLPHGIYRIYWSDPDPQYHRYTLASIGSDHQGRRWIAPCNFTGKAETITRSDSTTYEVVPVAIIPDGTGWEDIDHVVLIEAWINTIGKEADQS
jgi:hypothetical protein